MSASIPALPLPADTIAVLAGSSENISLKQSDVHVGAEFGPLLEQAVAAMEGHFAAGKNGTTDAAQLLEQLQDLPQGGKLLPLLEQMLDGAVASGADPEQVLEQLAARLETVEQVTDLDSQQAMAVALYQLVEENPAYRGAQASESPAINAKLAGLLQQLGIHDAGKAADRILSERLVPDMKTPAADQFGGQLQQQAPAAAQPQAEMMATLAAFKRLTATANSAAPEVSARADGLATAVPVQQAAVSATHAGSTLPSVTVEPPVGQGNWNQALSERVQWLVGQGVQRAQIKLNPAHLGPMEVRIQVQNDQAHVQFTSAHAMVRDAVEAALPRLREMLGSSGVELVNVDVSSGQSFAEQERAGERGLTDTWTGDGLDGDESRETLVETPVVSLLESGRLDLFA